jgi:thymidylate kinase
MVAVVLSIGRWYEAVSCRSQGTDMLELARALFEALNGSRIRYCHWKSNSHLDAAVNGRTDLDLLVHEEDQERFRERLTAFPIVAMASQAHRSFPAIEDYLGFDETTGRLLHLHVHYQLILGQRFIKNHHLPIEALFWANLTADGPVAIPVPELELIVLCIRVAMKLNAVEYLKALGRRALGRRGTPFPRAVDEEFAFLRVMAREPRMLSLLAESGLPIDADKLRSFLALVDRETSSPLPYAAFKRHVMGSLRAFQRRSPLATLPAYVGGTAHRLPLLGSLLGTPRKTLPGIGYAVAIVGADGSGKSTLAADLQEWLSWKLVVRAHYYGIPKKGAITILSFLVRVANRLRVATLKDLLGALTWTFVARTRASTSDAIEGDRAAGRVAVIDRFPHPSFATMATPMDGPQLAAATSRPARLLARREAEYYARVRRPDLLLLLKAPVDVLRRRRANLPYETQRAKAEAVMALVEDTGTVGLDATQPYEAVLLDAKRTIWQRIVLRERARA